MGPLLPPTTFFDSGTKVQTKEKQKQTEKKITWTLRLPAKDDCHETDNPLS